MDLENKDKKILEDNNTENPKDSVKNDEAIKENPEEIQEQIVKNDEEPTNVKPIKLPLPEDEDNSFESETTNSTPPIEPVDNPSLDSKSKTESELREDMENPEVDGISNVDDSETEITQEPISSNPSSENDSVRPTPSEVGGSKKSKGPAIVVGAIIVLVIAAGGIIFAFKDKIPYLNPSETTPPITDNIENNNEETLAPHTHDWSLAWTNNEGYHWHECNAENCDITDNSKKDGYAEHVYDDDTDVDCNTCGYVRVVEEKEPEIITNQNFQGIVKEILDDCVIIGNSGMTLAFYNDDITGVLGDIKVNDEVSVVYSISNDENILDSINIVTAYVPVDENVEPVEPDKTIEDVFSDFSEELSIIAGREDEEAVVDDGGVNIPDSEKIETMELPFTVEGSGALWFRFAWKANKETSIVPGVNDVVVELQTPSGSLVTPDNIDKYGRYWIEDGIINYVLKDGRAGNYAFMVTKNGDQRLGDVSSQVVPLTGFITIDKADIAYLNGNLCAIWNVSGVRDDYLAITITAKKSDVDDAKEVLIYSGNTVDDGIHLIDMVELPNSKLNSGVYDFTISAQDIDVQTVNGKTGISSKTMSHSIEINDVEITKNA